MLKIALCDDEMEQQNMMALLTAEYFNGNANLKMYSDGRKLKRSEGPWSLGSHSLHHHIERLRSGF